MGRGDVEGIRNGDCRFRGVGKGRETTIGPNAGSTIQGVTCACGGVVLWGAVSEGGRDIALIMQEKARNKDNEWRGCVRKSGKRKGRHSGWTNGPVQTWRAVRC